MIKPYWYFKYPLDFEPHKLMVIGKDNGVEKIETVIELTPEQQKAAAFIFNKKLREQKEMGIES